MCWVKGTFSLERVHAMPWFSAIQAWEEVMQPCQHLKMPALLNHFW
jgi:hypothetical protein